MTGAAAGWAAPVVSGAEASGTTGITGTVTVVLGVTSGAVLVFIVRDSFRAIGRNG